MVCVEPLVILSVIFGYLMLSISGRCKHRIAFIPPCRDHSELVCTA